MSFESSHITLMREIFPCSCDSAHSSDPKIFNTSR